MNSLLSQTTTVKQAGQVECLGLSFPNEDARRKHFLNLLAEKLKDSEFRQKEGFPQGEDDAILAMSDPPYYTACPNPWLAEFVEHYGNPYDPAEKYAREPMAIDVSEGKTNQLYRAHSYHTKVPHLAIVPSILHYTEPGDIVLDGFAGSGMTGVAAQWCEAAPLAYRHKLELEWKKSGTTPPKWGARRVVLNDLSPAATFISANYNLPFDVEAFAEAGKQLLAEVEREIGWMYETLHSDGKTKGRIEYTVWSQIFSCPECAGEINFIDEALGEDKRVRDTFPCPHCGAEMNKSRLDRVLETMLNPVSKETVKRVKLRPAITVYAIGKTRYGKIPDSQDLELLSQINNLPILATIPTRRFPIEKMYHGSRIAPKGFTNTHHFYLPRAAHAMGLLWEKAKAHTDPRIRAFLLYMVEQAIWGLSVLNRYLPIRQGHPWGSQWGSQVNRQMTGIYYVGSQHAECSPWHNLTGKLDRLTKAFRDFRTFDSYAAISTGTATQISLPDECIDYVFTDPPFGENIYYADLNFFVESWHGVTTDAEPEAIIDRFKKKALPDYQHLMQRCFAEYHRVLKPGRWMTVVFSNSRASVWNAIQTALQQAGFVVAEVSALDKKQGSYRQVTSTTAVKQDLVISAYKPNGGLEQRLTERGAAPESVWDFVQAHLRHLSVSKSKNGVLEFVVERDPRRIYDRMIAWFVRHDYPVPLSSQEFQEGLRQIFYERDGMFFLPEQAAEYDKRRALVSQAPQLELFVLDERSAIDWLSDFLKKRPSTYQGVHPEFTVQMGAGWRKHEKKPELSALLEDNFLRYDASGDVPSQIHSYLSTNFKDLRKLEKSDSRLKAKAKGRWFVPNPSKAKDLEQKRERILLKEFETYKSATKRQMKESRLEVLRTGFKTAWAVKDYKTIIVIAEKLPPQTLQEDEKLLLWYDSALTRTQANA